MRYIFIYKSILQFGGAERFLFEFYHALKKKFDVKIFCKEFDKEVLTKFNISEEDLFYPKENNYLSWFNFLISNLNKSDQIFVQSGFKDIYLLKLFFGFNYSLFLHHPHFNTLLHADVLSFTHRKNKSHFLKSTENQIFFKKIKKKFHSKSKLSIELNALINFKAIRAAKRTYVLSNYAVNEKKKYFNINSLCLVPGISSRYLFQNDHSLNKKNQIIYFGRLTKEKRVDLLIKCFKKLNLDYRLIIIGTGPELKHLKKIAGDNQKIEFLGFVDDQQLINQIKKSKLFITLQWADFNLTVYESIALGTRVLYGNSNKIENFDLQFINSKMLFYTSIDPSQIQSKIIEILNLEPVKYTDYSFIKKYTWDNYVKLFLDEA